MKKTLKDIVTAGMIGLATLLHVKKAEANVSGNVKWIQTTEEAKSYGSYVESNVFYGLPKGVNGYTFVDLYNDGGYFGRTSWNKEIGNGISGNVEVNHFDEPVSNIGVGLKAQVPKLPENAFATISLMPLYVDRKGNRVNNQALLQYFGILNLPKGFTLFSFGELDVARGEWLYGELELGKKLFGVIRGSYNPSLISDGDMIPDLEHRFAVTVDF